MNVAGSTFLAGNSVNLNSNLEKLSSASQINKAADNASGMMISNAMSSEVRSMGQAIQNSNDAIGMIQVASGAMQEYSNVLNDVQDLTVRASSGIMNSSNLASIQKEINGLLDSANDILDTTSYNGKNLLQGGSNFSLSEGVDVNFGGGTTTPFVDVMSVEGREASLENLSQALESANLVMADLGSSQNALEAHANTLSVTQVNTESARSQIADLDFAKESIDFNKNNLLEQTGLFAQSQRNISQENAMSLLN